MSEYLQTIKTIAQFTGIGGLALFVVGMLLRGFIRKVVYPQLSSEQAYKLLNRFLMVIVILCVAGLLAWIIIIQIQNRQKEVAKDKSDNNRPQNIADNINQGLKQLPTTLRADITKTQPVAKKHRDRPGYECVNPPSRATFGYWPIK